MSFPRLIPLLFAFGALAPGVVAGGHSPSPRGTPRLLGPRLADFVQTSADGDRFKSLPPVRFTQRPPGPGAVVTVTPKALRQTLVGIGGALTESSAFVLANLPRPKRDWILDQCFGPKGADFTMARTHIGACDFCVEGRYSYDDVPGDVTLKHFSIAPDRRGFSGSKDPAFALLPLIKAALARNPRLKLVASPWTAPAWMKDNQDWYGHGVGGTLLPQHHDTFARYMVKYLNAYRAQGVAIWGSPPINEPLGNGGQWESTEFTATAMRDYLKLHLGPQLKRHGLGGVKVIQFDHNRDANAIQFAEAALGDPETATYVWGTGLHWYSSTNSAEVSILDQLHDRFPTKPILHTEGCIDGIRTEDSSPGGKFLGWKNETWWWTESATDWGYYWAPPSEKPSHPRYAPVHRYARDLIDGLNHWFVGWIDWNLVLDQDGGPNHVNNFCAAPIMVDRASGEVHFTPLYYVMAHFSRYLRPGDRIVEVSTASPGLGPDDFRATAAVSRNKGNLVVIAFNKSRQPLSYDIQIGARCARVVIPGNAIQTMRFSLSRLIPKVDP